MGCASDARVKSIFDIHEDLLKIIFKFMIKSFEDVSDARKAELCHIFALYTCDVSVALVDLDAFYKMYATSKFFKKILWSDLQIILRKRKMFFVACENAFQKKLLTGGIWHDQFFLMLLGDHSMVQFSLERGKVRSTMNYLYLKVRMSHQNIGWRTTSTTITRKLALPGPDVEQYWWFNFPLTAVQTQVVEEWLPAQLFKELLEVFFRMARERRANGPHQQISYV